MPANDGIGNFLSMDRLFFDPNASPYTEPQAWKKRPDRDRKVNGYGFGDAIHSEIIGGRTTYCSEPYLSMQNSKNIRMTVAYDGTCYLGWQKTPTGPSVEDALQKALEKILQHEVHLQAASRTDAGVHAEGQEVNFFTHKNIDPGKLQIGINSLIPKDIVVLNIQEASSDFHPTLNCVEKEYRYSICLGRSQLPQYRLYSWHIHHPLEFYLMKTAASCLVGEHDFSAFTNVKKNETYTDYLRKVECIDLVINDKSNRFFITIRGNRFLYKMVRNIVGTLVYVGLRKIEAGDIGRILESRKRPLTGVTAPAHGLSLISVRFPYS